MKNAKKKLAQMGYKIKNITPYIAGNSRWISCHITNPEGKTTVFIDMRREMGRYIKFLARHHCGRMNP